MLRFLLILALSLYILSKIGGFLLRASSASQSFRPNPPRQPDGKVNVDSPTRKEPKTGKFKGGDYIDYEEVK